MKKLILFKIFLLIVALQVNGQMNKAKWVEDINFLQKTVNNDFSFLFDKISKDKFDKEVENLRKSIYIHDFENHQAIVGVAKLVALFQYGHTFFSFHTVAMSDQFGFNKAQFTLKYFTDGIYITKTSPKYQNLLGAQVIEIENMPTDLALSLIRPVCPVENEQYFKQNGLDYLRFPEILHAVGVTKKLKSDISLTLLKDNKKIKQTFKVFPDVENEEWVSMIDNMKSLPHYLKHPEKYYYYEYISKHKVLYVKQTGQQNDPNGPTIEEFYKEIFQFIHTNDVEKFVLDVRLNGGGNNYLNKPIITGTIKSKLNKEGNFFVIIGKRTYSAAQNLVNELDYYTNAIFIGEPTSENINFFGDTKKIVLPNSKLNVYLSFAWWQDKPVWENNLWFMPDTMVDLNFQHFIKEKDPVLETIFNYDKTKDSKK